MFFLPYIVFENCFVSF